MHRRPGTAAAASRNAPAQNSRTLNWPGSDQHQADLRAEPRLHAHSPL